MTNTRRNCSYVFGALTGVLLITLLIVLFPGTTGIIAAICIGISGSTLVSCLILKNNFVGDLVLDILDWGFVSLPGVIFTLDLDGLIWLLTVKLIFWILGFVLAIVCGLLGIIVGAVVSIFVYPYAILKSYRHPEEIEV